MKCFSRLAAIAIMPLLFAPPLKAGQMGLPAAWDGVWRGTTTLSWAMGKVETAAMELHVSPLANSNAKAWQVSYEFSDRREARAYEIRPADEGGAGRFIIDEKNGFLIDNYLSGNTLYSQFTINGNLVTTRFELQGETMAVELTMFDASNPRRTKLTGGSFEVASFSPKYIQRGILQRESAGAKHE